MVRLHNSAPTVSTFLLLSRMQGTKKCLKLNGFSKKKTKTNKQKKTEWSKWVILDPQL